MAETKPREAYQCRCPECSKHPTSETAKLHRSINHVTATLDEKNRRRFVGLLAMQNGYGGVQYYATVTGLSRTTILRGQREIQQADAALDGRIRSRGGGGKFAEKKMHP